MQKKNVLNSIPNYQLILHKIYYFAISHYGGRVNEICNVMVSAILRVYGMNMNSQLGRWKWTDKRTWLGKSLVEHRLAARHTLLKCQKYRVVVSCRSNSVKARTTQIWNSSIFFIVE